MHATRFQTRSHRRPGIRFGLPGSRVIAGLLALLALAAVAQDPRGSALPTGSAGLGGREAPAASLAGPSPLAAGALAEPDFLPVEEAYPLAIEPDGERSLRLVWQMPPGYYLYRHAFDFTLTRNGSVIPLEARLPPALTREDEYFGRVQVYYDSADVILEAVEPIAATRLEVTSQGCADAGLCYPPRTQTFTIGDDGAVAEVTAPPRRGAVQPTGGGVGPSLAFMLLLAFAGGMILNLMPCVLPVLSLKVFGYASAQPGEAHRHGLLYSAGVVLSFLAIAAALIALRAAGQAIGWGFQLQSPGFVLALAYLFVVLGLAMSGVIELGNQLMNLGSSVGGRGGAAGSFFTGVLAVVVASPCTAPFMGTALGYALLQPPLEGLAVFAALGAGMATPMLLLSYSEAARRLMPRPGVWMERLKQALAFPLYATALWLFWVAGRQTSVDVMAAALLGALFVALGLWLWRASLLARGSAVACLLVAAVLASWRPALGPDAARALPAGSVAYSADALADLRRRGKPVFVDVTADWCITCLANEQAVLATERVQRAFSDAGVTYMVADWTDYDPEIADFVASHGRSGIPLYVLYDGSRAPRLLPQLLRRSTVLDALERLGPARVAATRP